MEPTQDLTLDAIVVDMELELPDLQALQRYVLQRAMEEQRSLSGPALILGFSLFAAIVFASLHLLNRQFDLPSMAAGIGLCAVAVLLIARAIARLNRPSGNSTLLGKLRMRFDPAGVHSERVGQMSFTAWSRVQAIGETGDHIFLPVDRMMGIIVPKRYLTSPSAEVFLAQIRRWHAGRASGAEAETVLAARRAALEKAVPLPEFAHSKPSFASELWRDLAANLIAGARVFAFRNVQPADFRPGFGQVVALLLFTLALHILYDYSAAEEPQFEYYGIYSWLACVALGLWVCALVARTLSPRPDTRAMVVAMLAVAPYAITTLWIVSFIPDYDGVLFPMLAGFILLVLGTRTIRASYGFAKASSLLILLVASIIVGVSAHHGYLYPHIWGGWQDDEVSAARDTSWQGTESTLFDQPERIADALDELAPERPGVPDVYFVGFAGDGSEGVFRREALFGKQVFAERMGSGLRSLDLINDDNDRIAYPLGTASGLRYGLVHLAERMNKEEDILVLFLTSHGSKDDGIYVHNGDMPLNDIEPEVVQRALDASGIKWRIVIVSACYAGTFIEPLQSQNTMVITASDADHASFGCADDRDLTYFGEAFLRDALPKAGSLEEGFEAARRAIRKRERAEKLTPSNPQIFIGEAMRGKLAELGKFPLPATSPAVGPADAVTVRAGQP